MKPTTIAYLVLATVPFFSTPSRSAETAQARMWCLSLHFQQGSDSFGDTLDLSTISGTPNGELAPYNGLQYVSGFALDSSGFPIGGTLYLNLPPSVDDNNNGWNDFFEVAQGVSASSSGVYTTPLGGGTVTANWNRGAGAKDGTCVLTLVDNAFGDLGQFQHSFELIEYTGPLTYTPGTNIVKGSVNLTKTGDPSSQLQGPVQFVKVPSDRFNVLNLQAGIWTNAQAQPLTFGTNQFLHDQTAWPTNYYGLMVFDDGDLTTAAPDYLTWVLSIDDANDANRNGIPDFSDDPWLSPRRQPQLSLFATSTNLQLTIAGDVGSTCLVQQARSLPAPSWQALQTVTLTNAKQLISLPIPATPPAFWRVQLQ